MEKKKYANGKGTICPVQGAERGRNTIYVGNLYVMTPVTVVMTLLRKSVLAWRPLSLRTDGYRQGLNCVFAELFVKSNWFSFENIRESKFLRFKSYIWFV